MDHQEEHHLYHRKEREEKKRHEHEREQIGEKKRLPIHPFWFFALGVVLIVAIVLT